MPSSTLLRQTKVGRNLKEAVENSPMLQRDLAKKVGVHQSSFSYWYRTGVTHPYAQKVSEILDIDPKTIRKKLTYKRQRVVVKPRAAKPAPRSVNLELLSIIANKKLTKDQEDSLHLLADAFVEQNNS
jgi:DNA topoisomerase VI subunit B